MRQQKRAPTPRNALDQPATTTAAQTAARLQEKALHNQGAANRERIRVRIGKTLST